MFDLWREREEKRRKSDESYRGSSLIYVSLRIGAASQLPGFLSLFLLVECGSQIWRGGCSFYWLTSFLSRCKRKSLFFQ